MARYIGTKFVVEGEKEYKNKIEEIRTELKLAKSDMTLWKQATDDAANSQEYLQAKTDHLNKILNAQEKIVDANAEVLRKTRAEQALYNERVSETERKLNNAKDKLDEMTRSGKASEEEIEKQKDQIAIYEKQEESAISTADTAKNFREQEAILKDLVDQYDGTIASYQAITSVIRIINEIVPEMNLSFDETTGALSMTDEAMEKVIADFEEMTAYDEAIAKQADLIQQKAEAERLQEEATQRLAEAESHVEEVQQTANSSTLEGIAALAEAQTTQT